MSEPGLVLAGWRVSGRIADIWHVEDVMSVMGQLGVLPAPPDA
jgi:hypothetical protein